MSLFDWLGSGSRKRTTDETVEAVQAVKAIAEALHADEPVPVDAVKTADRVLAPPIAWESLLRDSARHRLAAQGRRG